MDAQVALSSRKSRPACSTLREQCEDDNGGMSQSMIVFLSEGAACFPALRSCVPLEATMLCVRDNNGGHYTNSHVVLHANSTNGRP
jgi:hypothetical protein